LTREQDVIDIGCGPGRFVAQFAQSAHHVVGTDLSSRMLQYGAEYARELGVTNTSYIESDFKKADLDALGWRKRFDLVFSSITPAISGRAGLEQMMAMSRGWCFNSCFVHSRDTLQEKMAQELLGKTKEDGWNGHWHWFYALFNLLWLRGYYPETSYYTEQEEERLPADHKTAADLAARLAGDFGQEVSELEGAIFSYLSAHADEDGFVTRCRETTYGWILWNVNDRTER
jgi:SAM-dependent methyltransferase